MKKKNFAVMLAGLALNFVLAGCGSFDLASLFGNSGSNASNLAAGQNGVSSIFPSPFTVKRWELPAWTWRKNPQYRG